MLFVLNEKFLENEIGVMLAGVIRLDNIWLSRLNIVKWTSSAANLILKKLFELFQLVCAVFDNWPIVFIPDQLVHVVGIGWNNGSELVVLNVVSKLVKEGVVHNLDLLILDNDNRFLQCVQNLFKHALLLNFARHLGDQLHIDVLLHHNLVHPENVGEEGYDHHSVNLINETFSPVDPHENRWNVEEHQEGTYKLMKSCFFKEDEEENLGEVCEHYLQNHV